MADVVQAVDWHADERSMNVGKHKEGEQCLKKKRHNESSSKAIKQFHSLITITIHSNKCVSRRVQMSRSYFIICSKLIFKTEILSCRVCHECSGCRPVPNKFRDGALSTFAVTDPQKTQR